MTTVSRLREPAKVVFRLPEEPFHFNQLEDVDAPVFVWNVNGQHGNWIFTQHAPASDVRQFQGMNL